MSSQRAALLPVLLLASTCALGGVTTTVVDIPTRGVNQRFLYVHPDAPKANIVDLFGGTGSLGIQDDGSFSNPAAYCNPVARNLQAFADHGYAIALVDATSDGRVRNYPDVLEVINYLHAHDNVPTWVIGGDLSTKGAANIVGQLPVSYPAGVIFHAPDTVDASILALVKRPSLVVWHGLDTAQFGAALYAGLTAAPTKEQIILSGGSNAGCGYHRFNGADAEFAAGIAGFIDRINPTLVGIASYQGLFYNAPAESESGWGINFAHQGDTLFASWFTYDTAGRGSWFVVTANKTAPDTYGGKLYTTRGPAFNALPWDPSTVVATEAGTATFVFTDANNGTFTYVIGGSIRPRRSFARRSARFRPARSARSPIWRQPRTFRISGGRNRELRVRLGHQPARTRATRSSRRGSPTISMARRCGSSSRRRRRIPTCTRAIFIGLRGRDSTRSTAARSLRRKSEPRRSRSRTATTRPSTTRSSLPGWPRP